MKLHGETIVLIPYFDHEKMKQWFKLSFVGEMDSRFLYKKLADFIKTEFGQSVSKSWIKKSCPILNEYKDGKKKGSRRQLSHDGSFTKFANEWCDRMESNEDEDRADFLLQTGNPEGPTGPLPTVPDTN